MLEWGEKTQQKGWARHHDNRVKGSAIPQNPPRQLTPEQNVLLVDVKREMDRYAELVNLAATRGVKGKGPVPLMEHAFDVGKTKVKDCIKEYNRRGGTLERKKRSDAGKTLVNSNRKREQMCTPFNWFSKQKRRQHQGEVLESAELKQAYANLSEEDRLRSVMHKEQKR